MTRNHALSDAAQWEDLLRRIRLLYENLRVCPNDVVARVELASLLEQVGAHEEALASWRRVLAHDSNNLRAWEGVQRCRLQLEHALERSRVTSGRRSWETIA